MQAAPLSRLGQAFQNNMQGLYRFINAREKLMRGVFLFSAVFSILALATITVFLFVSGVPFIAKTGFAEFVFTEYLGEFLPSAGVAIAIAMLWRLITYYPYLFVGALIVPKWITKHFGKLKKK